MYKKVIFALLFVATLLLTMAGCTNQIEVSGETNSEESTAPIETVPGVEILDEPIENPFENDNTEASTAPTTGKTNSAEGTTAPTTGKSENPDGSTAPTTGKNEGTEGTTAPTTGENESTEGTTASTTGENKPTEGTTAPAGDKNEETQGTTAGTTGKDESPETTTPPSTDKEEEPDETTPPATDKEEEPDVTTPPTTDETVTSYEWYHAMSGAEQKAFIESFDSIEDFFAWYNSAKAEYEALHPDVEIGDGNVDLGGGN